MATRLLIVPQIGEVTLSKRRGTSKMRLSINASGQVRVGMPYWIPYEAGILFIKSHKSWIQQQIKAHAPTVPSHDSRIGKHHRLIFLKGTSPDDHIKVRVGSTTIEVKTNLDTQHPSVQKKVLQACERALKDQSEQLLPPRVENISRKHQLPYNNLRIRKLTSRWGSCSSHKDISLSFYLVQLPWELIDYVILHELAHTRFHNHSRSFWRFMEQRVPDLAELKRQLKAHKPRIEAY